MTAIYSPWRIGERAVEEAAVHASVGAVVFAGPVSVEQPDDDRFRAVLLRGVSDLHFVDPLGHRVVVHLLDFVFIHHGFDHQFRPIAIDFGRRQMNELETELFLQANDVFCPNRIGVPKRFVEILSVPASEFGCAMVYVVKRAHAFEDSFDLPISSDIAARIEGGGNISLQRKADFVGLMHEVARNNEMSTVAKVLDQSHAYNTFSTCD